ncbi:MAG: flavoprotein [Bacteroidia bacterium]
MKVLLGICGSIAAYKSAYLVRHFIKAGHEVKVIMTSGAADFVAPLTLATLSKNAVHTQLFDKSNGEWVNHVELGNWAEIFIIAPATANTLAKMANGMCDNLLLATYLSATCPVIIAPAMDRDMYLHPSTQKNLQILESFGNTIIPAQEGELASGLEGIGRMTEPEEIFDFVLKKKVVQETL